MGPAPGRLKRVSASGLVASSIRTRSAAGAAPLGAKHGPMHPWPHLLELRQRHPRPLDPLTLSSKLRKTHPAEEAVWLSQQLSSYWDALRLQAFADPLCLMYDDQGLQMASRWPLARRRAELLDERFPPGRILELGAGIGGDTLELGRLRPLLAIERDPVRRACLEHNLEVSGLLERVTVRADWSPTDQHDCVGLYADPMRRDAHGRNLAQPEPDPALLWQLGLPTCLKLAPGLDEAELPPGTMLDYVSHQGVCKEAVAWTLPQRVASASVQCWLHLGEDRWLQAPRQPAPPLGPCEPGLWLHEPDPAAVRTQCWLPGGGWRIDETLALLATPAGLHSPWTSAFQVLEIGDADLANLKKLLKRWDFHPLEIKKRGFDVEPEELRRKLPRGKHGGPGTLFLTRVAGRHRAIVCRRQFPEGASQ